MPVVKMKTSSKELDLALTRKLVTRWVTSRLITEWIGLPSQQKRDLYISAFLVLTPINGTFQKYMMPRLGNLIIYSSHIGRKKHRHQSMAPRNTGNINQTQISSNRWSLTRKLIWFKQPWKAILHFWNYILNSKVIYLFAINLADLHLFTQYLIVTYNLQRCFVNSLKYSRTQSNSQIPSWTSLSYLIATATHPCSSPFAWTTLPSLKCSSPTTATYCTVERMETRVYMNALFTHQLTVWRCWLRIVAQIYSILSIRRVIELWTSLLTIQSVDRLIRVGLRTVQVRLQ